MGCQKCGSDRIMEINGKTSDLFYGRYKNNETDGYVPDDIGFQGGGDYIDFDYCLECGQMQGEWPIPEPDLSEDAGWNKERSF